jgi:hypothetical protein
MDSIININLEERDGYENHISVDETINGEEKVLSKLNQINYEPENSYILAIRKQKIKIKHIIFMLIGIVIGFGGHILWEYLKCPKHNVKSKKQTEIIMVDNSPNLSIESKPLQKEDKYVNELSVLFNEEKISTVSKKSTMPKPSNVKPMKARTRLNKYYL